MKTKIKYILGVFFVLILTIISCTEETYTLGDLTAPSNVILNAEILGQDANHPNGDGSGDVIFSITGDGILGTKIDYDADDALNLVYVPTGTIAKKYTKLGLNTYRVTVVAYGAGGTSTNITKEITVRSDFTPDPVVITNITNNASKTWVVDKSVAGHFGVGPWNPTSITPEWWAGGINEKVNCCNCFYTSTFTFSKIAVSGTYQLTVASPDGAFTKTGALAGGLPGIPASGAEGCYAYAGGTSSFSFVPSSSGIAASAATTKIGIQLSGVNTFIGYGAVQKEYEIMVSTPTYLYLRVRGTETGNAWYLKLKPAP